MAPAPASTATRPIAEQPFAAPSTGSAFPGTAPSGWLSHPATLPLLCVGMVAAEAVLLSWAHAGATLALAPQIAALAPWGVFHDLRWLLVYADSWPTAIAGILALVAVRGAITAVMVRAAWPSSVPFAWRRTLLRALTSTAVAALLLSPCASLLVAFSLAPISDIWLAAIPTALGIALFVHHGPVVCWWLRHPRLRSTGWLLLSFVELTLAGAMLVAAPTALKPLIVVAAGLFDALAWRGVVGALAVPHYRLRLAPVAPAGLAALIGVTVVSVTAASAPSAAGASEPLRVRAAAQPKHGAAPTPASAAAYGSTSTAALPRPVLIASGYNIGWHGGILDFGPKIAVREFSYKGTDKHGVPLTYSSDSTQAALPALLKQFRAQVAAYARASGGPIDIVGESEGALLTTAYLLSTPHPPVRSVVLLSPLVRPGRASYPGPGQGGPGIAAAWELRGIARGASNLTPLHVSADSAFISSLSDHTDALRHAYSCPVAGVRQYSILPLADAVGVPYGALRGSPHEVVDALHGTLLINPSVRGDIAEYLTAGALPSTGDSRLERVVQAGTAAWQAPARPLHSTSPSPAACRQTRAALTAWLGAN